jgi:hypothetical protein
MKMMIGKVVGLVVASCLWSSLASSGADQLHDIASSNLDAKAMEEAFLRSEKVHAESMDRMMKTMTTEKAFMVLAKNNLTNPSLVEVANELQGTKAHLRKQPKGYAGLDGARTLLNDMIFESMSKYDAEIAKCTEYYATQCAAMEGCRGQIAASNFIAANSRSLILDAQARINRCEIDIPTRKLELKLHKEKCKNELKRMKDRLSIILGDIEVMVVILKMTDCDAKSFIQKKRMDVLRCLDPCTKKSFITFKEDSLKKQISKLRSSRSNKLVQETFADLFDGVRSLESMEFLQLDAQIEPVINKTEYNNPPVPRTKVPANPCNDPDGGAPSAATKRAAKCVLSPGACYKLQERFLLIQAGIKDERDALLEDIASMEHHCEETEKTLETQIKDDEDMLSDAQVKLAFATEKEASAGETARQTAAEHEQLDADLKTQMKTCTDNYLNFESELCALKKIRGELYKMKGDGHSGFFQDCEVSKWDPEECTKKCKQKGGEYGQQKLMRSVLTHPDGGAKCLPLAAMRTCNQHPCPVDCKVEIWSGWSKCSAECGGGVQQRLRAVERAMKYGGKPCGSTSESKACNVQSCEKDCELSEWTKWSWCSKDCDGGTRKRSKFVKTKAEGQGKCPDAWSEKRLQYKACNMKRCELEVGEKVIKCNETLDIMLLLDGSGSLGESGWKAEIKAAQLFVDAFSGTGAHSSMGVILYSGPRTWGGVSKCMGDNVETVDLENTCKIKTVTHFTEDMAKVKELIGGLTWPQGSTLTSLALTKAKAELSLGGKSAKSIVVVITDGRPLSYRNTKVAARSVRKAARLIWVPVTRYAPLKYIKGWATRRWQENVVQVKSFEDLETPDPMNHVVANICPAKEPVVAFG